jgi:hypothetical protein
MSARREVVMRTTKRRRPRKEQRLAVSPQIDLAELAESVSYVISPEHKDYLTTAGPGKLRSDASACPRGLDFDDVVEWLRNAFRAGDVSADLDGGFPRYAWSRVDGQVYEARLSNAGLGEYKGYPIHEYESPSWLP